MSTYSIVEQYRNKIYDFHYDNSGMKKCNIVDFNPIIGTLSDVNGTQWKTLYNESVNEIKFKSIGDWWDYVYQYQYKIPLYGNISPIYQYISERYKNYNNYNINFLKKAFIDIEVYSEDGFPHPDIAAWNITSIAIKDVSTGKFYVVSTKKYNKYKTELDIDPNLVNFRYVKDDSEILSWLVKVLRFIKPDILCGWYSDNFDFPYMINRFDYLFEDEEEKLNLSPIKRVSSEKMKNQRDFRNIISGITLFDYMKLYKKYIFKPRESYSLNFISSVELDAQKLDYSEYSSLNDMWNKNPQKYIDYNIFDVELIDKIDQKLGLIDLAATVAYKAKCNLNDVMGTIKIWDVYFYNYLKEKGIMIPPLRDTDNIESEHYAGAYVKEPKCQVYDWVLSLDLNGLYPHLQQQFNISPECLIKDESVPVSLDEISPRLLNGEIKCDSRYILSGNGCYFKKDVEGFIPKILREIYTERSNIKDKMLKKEQELEELESEMKKRGFL